MSTSERVRDVVQVVVGWLMLGTIAANVVGWPYVISENIRLRRERAAMMAEINELSSWAVIKEIQLRLLHEGVSVDGAELREEVKKHVVGEASAKSYIEYRKWRALPHASPMVEGEEQDTRDGGRDADAELPES